MHGRVALIKAEGTALPEEKTTSQQRTNPQNVYFIVLQGGAEIIIVLIDTSCIPHRDTIYDFFDSNHDDRVSIQKIGRENDDKLPLLMKIKNLLGREHHSSTLWMEGNPIRWIH